MTAPATTPASTLSNHFDLVADIGGTHARFSLADAQQNLSATASRKVADFPNLTDALADYLTSVPDVSIRRAALAVATAVDGDDVQFTNSPWRFSGADLRSRFGLEKLLVLNDFAALAHSLPSLGADDLRQIGPGQARADAPKAVLGPGTGLGVAGLIPVGANWIALPGEGGHASFSPADEREAAILAQVRRHYPHVSFERLVSGIGLPNLLQAVAEVDGLPRQELDPPAITAGAQAGDPLCRAVIDSFCAMLGSAAGNLALTLGAKGGVYIGGGVIPRLGSLFECSPFRQRFEAKGRFAPYLAEIPTFVILAASPAMTGAARALNQS